MQYNIKIKSNDSEFSLNSQDRDIIAREMDLYFSFFFGASKEFESKIKKVEIKDSNVKSIEEIEKPKEKLDKINQHITEEPVDTPIAKEKEEIITEDVEQNNTEEIKDINDILVLNDTNKNEESKVKYEDIPTEEISIEDLMLSDETLDIPTTTENVSFKNEKDPKQSELEDIFNSDVSETEISATPTELEFIEQKNEPSILDNFEYPEPTILTQEKIYNIPEYDLEKEIKAKENIINLEEKIINEKPAEAPTGETHDFKDFIKNFDSQKTIDDFLICSYYIKNIADIESFTMKSINAKLFRATGRIAGMSILNELLQKEFLKVVNDSDIKQYCIT